MSEDIMKFEDVLPEDFTGVFYFTNASDTDFIGTWGGKAYTYPAKKTTPMVIVDATPREVQNIRKKFAKEYAEREFFKSKEAKQLTSIERANNAPALNSIQQANVYNEANLTVYIRQCLDPLPLAKAIVSDLPKLNIEEKMSRDEDGEVNTQIVMGKQDLRFKEKKGRI